MIKTPPIIVILTIDNIQKTVHLKQKRESWNIYDIVLDNLIHGQAQKVGNTNRWAIVTAPDSAIQPEHHNALSDALERARNPNH
ncbi:MAG: hypothetical protein U0X41_02700 [Chitinophagales bacterium]